MIEDRKPESFIRPELKVGDEVKVSSNSILEIIERNPILILDPKPQKGGFLRSTIMSRNASTARIKLKSGFEYVVEISAIA